MENGRITALGSHALADYYQCQPEVLNDPVQLEKWMIEATEKVGAEVVSSHFHTYSPVGISGIVVIKESHFALHTWPEHSYAAVDFFTCRPGMDIEPAYLFLKDRFGSIKSKLQVLPRGSHEMIRSLSVSPGFHPEKP